MDSLSLVNYLYFYIFSKLLSEYFVSEQNTLKRLGVNNIPGIEEVNLPPPPFLSPPSALSFHYYLHLVSVEEGEVQSTLNSQHAHSIPSQSQLPRPTHQVNQLPNAQLLK